jgi:hypothetical protein
LVPASDAARVAEAAWRTGDIMAAGQHCGVALTPHAIVLRRTADRMTAIDQEMSRAIDAGVLKKFNATYRENRLEAKRKGEPFISYSEACRDHAAACHRTSNDTAQFSQRRHLSQACSTNAPRESRVPGAPRGRFDYQESETRSAGIIAHRVCFSPAKFAQPRPLVRWPREL